MTKFIIALSLFLVGCSEADQDKHWPRETLQLQSGQVVSCRWTQQEACGLKLSDCADGNTYQCQNNVVKL